APAFRPRGAVPTCGRQVRDADPAGSAGPCGSVSPKVARALPDQPRPSRGSGRRARDGRMPRLPLVAVSKYTEIVASGNCFSELLGMGWFVACAVEAGRCRRRRASSAAVGPVAILWYAAGWYGGRAGPYGGTCDVLGAFRPGRARGGCGAGPRGRPWRPDAP